MTHGKNAMAKSDWTIGTAAPGSGDLELRINTTDGLGRTITRHDVRLFVEGLERALTEGTFLLGTGLGL